MSLVHSSEHSYVLKHPLYPIIQTLEECLEILHMEDIESSIILRHAFQVQKIAKLAKHYFYSCLLFKPAPGSVENNLICRLVSLGFQCLLAIDLHCVFGNARFNLRFPQLDSPVSVCKLSSPFSTTPMDSPIGLNPSHLCPGDFSSNDEIVTPDTPPSIHHNLKDKKEPSESRIEEIIEREMSSESESETTKQTSENDELSEFELAEQHKIVKAKARESRKTKGDSKKKRPNYSGQITEILKEWLFQNTQDPYPSESEKQMLSELTSLSITQINNWYFSIQYQ